RAAVGQGPPPPAPPAPRRERGRASTPARRCHGRQDWVVVRPAAAVVCPRGLPGAALRETFTSTQECLLHLMVERDGQRTPQDPESPGVPLWSRVTRENTPTSSPGPTLPPPPPPPS